MHSKPKDLARQDRFVNKLYTIIKQNYNNY